jgi:hypothetical protein
VGLKANKMSGMKLSIRYLKCLLVAILVQPAEAVEPPAEAANRNQKMQKLMEASLDWYKLLPKEDARAPLKPQLVLSWRNPVRGEQAKDMLALWLDEGRPAAAASVFPWDGKLCHEFVLLTGEAGLVARNGDAVVWSPRVGGVEFRDVPEAPTPADSPGVRLRQMKSLAEGFSATLIGWKANDAGPEQLRLLPKPLYRYEIGDSPRAHPDLLDGALLAFVQGLTRGATAVGACVSRPRWQYVLPKRPLAV